MLLFNLTSRLLFLYDLRQNMIQIFLGKIKFLGKGAIFQVEGVTGYERRKSGSTLRKFQPPFLPV